MKNNDNWIEKRVFLLSEKFPNPLYEVKSFGTEDYKYVDDEIESFLRQSLLDQREEIMSEVMKALPDEYSISIIDNYEKGITKMTIDKTRENLIKFFSSLLP